MRLERTILSNLLYSDEFTRKVIPHLKEDYFLENNEKVLFKIINTFFTDHNTPPSKEVIRIEAANQKNITDSQLKEVVEIIDCLNNEPVDSDWLYDKTEKFCKEKAVYNAILSSIAIIDGRDKIQTQDSIPHLLSNALAVCFDNHVGHDYLEDVSTRYDFYHRVEEKIRFDIDLLNKITKGGLSKKTLNIILAGTGVGKSLFMCHVSAASLLEGKNVLYITMEMAEERIAERIDANLMNVTMDELKVFDRNIFENKVAKIADKTKGKLIVKEYPTAQAHAGHFRALLEELKLKRNFKPDIIMIDYLNICASQRLRAGSNVNSYTLVKSIAEELRGLAVEYDVPIMSATQTTRTGFTSTDIGLEDTSESFGLPATADFMIALISTEELEELNQIMVKQLKNRYSDPNYYKRFVVGVDRSKMKMYNVEESAQEGLSDAGKNDDDVPVFDKSSFGQRMKQQRKQDFSGFNF
jgi:replicative DNA helicase